MACLDGICSTQTLDFLRGQAGNGNGTAVIQCCDALEAAVRAEQKSVEEDRNNWVSQSAGRVDFDAYLTRSKHYDEWCAELRAEAPKVIAELDTIKQNAQKSK